MPEITKITEMSEKKTLLSKSNRALLSWISCEAGVENVTFNPHECARLFNEYKKACVDEQSMIVMERNNNSK